jgi:transcriptional regulator
MVTCMDLVQRDARVLQLRSRGKTKQEIADELGLTRLDVHRILERSKYPNN